VFGVPDAIWGERVVVAIVAGAAFDPSELGRFAARELASFKRPRAYATLDALCTLASGKVDRATTARAAEHRLRAL
jgi:acyl-CoA synthetase (AMP-forming)/AMP-acid ligase II